MTTYKPGDKIRVRFSGTLEAGRQFFATLRVREISGNRVHYLYLKSSSAGKELGITTEIAFGSNLRVDFSGVVTASEAGQPAGTIRVRTLFGFTHFLDPDSPFISKENKNKEPAMAEINSTRETISYPEVSARIEELENLAGQYEVIRLRTGDILKGGFDNEDNARAYIDTEDYNPVRVGARPAALDEQDATELDELRELDGEAAGIWSEWIKNDVTLYRNDYFSADWAREQVKELLSVSTDALSGWPLNLIDWSDAATERRDAGYTSIRYDDTDYWGADE